MAIIFHKDEFRYKSIPELQYLSIDGDAIIGTDVHADQMNDGFWKVSRCLNADDVSQ